MQKNVTNLSITAEQLAYDVGNAVLCVARGHVNRRVDRVLDHLVADFVQHAVHQRLVRFVEALFIVVVV